MYKTVRKGDASLQYTILSQNDQFFGNPPSPTRPQKTHTFVHKLTIIVVIIVIFICGLSATLLINHTHRGHFTRVSMSQTNHDISSKFNNNLQNSQSSIIENNHTTDVEETWTISTDNNNKVSNSKITEDAVLSTSSINKEIETNTLQDNLNQDVESITSTISNTPETLQTNIKDIKNLETSTLKYLSSSILTSSESISSTLETLKDTTKSFLDDVDLTTDVKSSTSTFKKAKMPRVTLKLRENETIPQMYMKAGIASYKKGNITTSVLAHGLSLEGLIFKTPEGTIKPWNEKWPFSNSSPYAQWKRDNEMREQIFAVLATLMAVSVLIFCVLTLAQLKSARRRWNNVEEPLIHAEDEEEEEEEKNDRSKLLEIEFKDSDKE